MYVVSFSPKTCWIVLVLYCYTGGSHRKSQAVLTDEAFRIAYLELLHHPTAPTLICTDLNADTVDIPTVTFLLEQKGWTDIGNTPRFCGGRPAQPTCFNHNAILGNRRDYMLVNHIARDSVVELQVLKLDEIPGCVVVRVLVVALIFVC